MAAEGMQMQMLGGRSSREAAKDVARRTQIPLLATVIGIMAFAGIGLSPDATGEFLFSLFAVIGISLLLSWVLAITATPLLAHYVFRRGDAGAGDQYGGPIFRAYSGVLRLALRLRWLVLAALVVITAACYVGFGRVEQQFFPDSNTPIFYVHYRLPQGADIEETAAATRFMLTYAPEESRPPTATSSSVPRRWTTSRHCAPRSNGSAARS